MPLTAQERDLLSSGKLSAIDLLSSKNNSPLDDRLELILLDLRENYSKHKRKVEDYLSVVPELASEQDLMIRLILEEFKARGDGCDFPTRREYIERFPQFETILCEFIPDESALETNSQPTQLADAQLVLASRYKLVGEPVGSGAFGSVYLGLDLKLNRPVAVKLPRTDSLDFKPNNYLDEARMLARFQHPNIVSIYDVGSTDEGQIYIVSQFVRGGTLHSEYAQYRGNFKKISDTLATVADALQFAHDRKIIHRDIKSANILIEKRSKEPLLADFGLAITEEELCFSREVAGTPAYMSPEQIRSEGHRLDGRTDIFSLGVVLYEMLTGQLPFLGSEAEICKRILQDDPLPPSSIDPNIPLELERICLKALCKQPSDRYDKASTMAQELRSWDAVMSMGTEEDSSKTIIPKGLRSFDEKDAGYFLSLLPGPRNRDGLPDSIAFWKEKIEQRDLDKTFTVGLIYGPSGCGKSSLVKAGLIPRLSKELIVLYVEATAGDTEGRLLRQLRKYIPDLEEGLGFADTLLKLRRTKGRKIVLIIDQFEQWLYSNRISNDGELERGLRQCDGERLQTLLMIRDDFYLGAARLMNQIDVPIVTGQNFMLIDLFDKGHAKKVLTRFGQAFEKLPAKSESLCREQIDFIDGVIDGLAEAEKVVSVRIALIADMLKNREWVPSTLKALGGLDGIGVEFLEETFSLSRSDARHRTHQVAARGILKALLPDFGTEIKGSMRSEWELKEASGYGDKATDFEEVIRILDRELRLITPTDPSGESRSKDLGEQEDGKRFYQLTHDYLIPSLREWLTRKQMGTRKGRAEIKLAERAATWDAIKENKQLPTFWEWMQIHVRTEPSKWKRSELICMQAANRYHLYRGLVTATAAIVASALGLGINAWNDHRLMERDAESLVQTIEKGEFAKLGEEFKKIQRIRSVIDPKLIESLDKTDPDSEERLKFSLALLPSAPKQLDFVLQRLKTAQASQIKLIVDQLRPYKATVLDTLWSSVEGDNKASWLPLASVLADFDPNSPRWLGIAVKVCDSMVQENALRLGVWIEMLRPASQHLIPQLVEIYKAKANSDRAKSEIDVATEILETYAASDFSTLHELILSGSASQFARIFELYKKYSSDAVMELQKDLARPFQVDPKKTAQENQRWRLEFTARQANGAVALMRLEKPKTVHDFLTVDRDPEALSQFIYRIRGRDVSPSLLVSSLRELKELGIPEGITARQQHYFKLYGMLLGLGEFSIDQLPVVERDRVIEELSVMYAQHPSRAVHSALGWLLRKWGQSERVRKVDMTPVDCDPSGFREWYVVEINPSLHLRDVPKTTSVFHENAIDPMSPIHFTMIVFHGGEFQMGGVGKTMPVTVPGPIAVSDREVTWRQFSSFDGDSHRLDWEQLFTKQLDGRQLQPEEPVFGINWLEAVSYCRWLTEAWLPGEENQCYPRKQLPSDPSNRLGWVDVSEPEDWDWPMDPSRPGFRLPEEKEWEYVAKAGMDTQYSFGTSDELLAEYGWFDSNSGGWSRETALKKPSLGGLFDIHGNLWEWNNDWFTRGVSRAYRGGGWDVAATRCRSASNNDGTPSIRNPSFGFRIVQSHRNLAAKRPEGVE